MDVRVVWCNRRVVRHGEQPAAPEDQPLTKPFPATDGWLLALRTGDLYSPDSWAHTTRVYRSFVRWIPRPFLAWRRGKLGFYVGWKVWGCDTEKQIGALGIAEREVYPGSVAMQGCTMRFSTSVE